MALGIGATIRHARERALERNFTLFILATGMPGVVVGAMLVLQIPDRTAQMALGVLTMGLGLYSWLNPGLGEKHAPINRNRRGYLLGGGVLFLIGVLNGSLTSGTGLFVTLWLVRWFGLDYRRAVAYTLILVGMFWNGTGAVTLGLLAGSLLGGYIGAHMAIKKGSRWIKRGFEVITLLVGLKLIVG